MERRIRVEIVGVYSFNNGQGYIQNHFRSLLSEVEQAIRATDASTCKTKASKEKTMPGKTLYSPVALNKAFREQFFNRGWEYNLRVKCDYSTDYYVTGYAPKVKSRESVPFRSMDFVKDKLGVEVQFGKYAFMVYNVCAKMTIFHKLGFIDAGVEIVPVKEFADEMSTGVSYFEQFVWDLEQRGVSNIDIPVLILGIR